MKIAIMGPARSLSGYGERTRDFIEDIYLSFPLAYIDLDICVTNWGNTLNMDYKPYYAMRDVSFDEILNSEYDAVFQIGIATEITNLPLAKKHIFITAGIETDTHPDITVFDNMEIWVSSEHSKSAFKQEHVQKIISVFPEVTNRYNFIDSEPSKILDEIGTDKYVLISGAWMPAKYGEDRKNIPYSIELAMRAFKGQSDVCILVHTSMGSYSEIENHTIDEIIKNIKRTVESHFPDNTEFPKIVAIHGRIDSKTLAELYSDKRLNWMFTLTHGEGFGRHLAEFAGYGGTIIAPKWSGYLDFLSPECNVLLDCELNQIHETAANKYLLPESKWAYVEFENIITALQQIKFDIEKNQQNINKIDEINIAARSKLYNFVETIYMKKE